MEEAGEVGSLPGFSTRARLGDGSIFTNTTKVEEEEEQRGRKKKERRKKE